MTTQRHYTFIVRGRLDPRRGTWFPGLFLAPSDDDTTRITGTIADQSALHGVLGRMRDLRLEIVALWQEGARPSDETGPSRPGEIT
ncbi:MAG TPA: hypothetical protein PK954_12130 [Anaerolineales bacterium]|nr:hypothetical protein [Anaerolineales bacterium]HRF46889.1 hypothetical protein [Anaerolineales bacterium]